MRAYFPRPYPDEVIGSLLIRACRHLGLPIGRLNREVLGGAIGASASFLMSSQLRRLAELTGIEAEALLMSHTVFPYITAFLPPSKTQHLRNQVLRGSDTGLRTLAALIHNATKTGRWRRFCPVCTAQERRVRDESYWHVSHQLPAVMVCPDHGTMLAEAKAESIRRLQLPHELRERVIAPPTTVHKLQLVGRAALDCQDQQRTSSASNVRRYRKLATEAGYKRNAREIASRQLSVDLREYFGATFLSAVGCSFTKASTGYWPALMLRHSVLGPFSTPKHILLRVFLENVPRGKKIDRRKPPGRAPRDYEQLDHQFEALIVAAIARLADGEQGLRAWDLLSAIGVLNIYKHNRDRLPRTGRAVATFRASRIDLRTQQDARR